MRSAFLMLVVALGGISCVSDGPSEPSRVAVASVLYAVFKICNCTGPSLATAMAQCVDVQPDPDGAIPLSAASPHRLTVTVANPGVPNRRIRVALTATWPRLTGSPLAAVWDFREMVEGEFGCCPAERGNAFVFDTPDGSTINPILTVDLEESGADLQTPVRERIELRIRLF